MKTTGLKISKLGNEYIIKRCSKYNKIGDGILYFAKRNQFKIPLSTANAALC